MKIKLENELDFFLLFIIIIKIIFIGLALSHFALSRSSSDLAKKTDVTVLKLKQYIEFIFVIGMAVLLLIHFNPYVKKINVDEESRFLFFLFGIILILTSDWNLFLTESPIVKNIISILK